jgi:iron complex outermembrane recepter protein
MKSMKRAISLVATTALWVGGPLAYGDTAPTYLFDQPAEDLGTALRAIAAQTGRELYASAKAVNGRTAPPLHGTMSVEAAVAHLLAGTRLTATYDNGAIVIRGRGDAPDSAAPEPPSPDIVVTGSHIRGAVVAGPALRLTREAIEDAGQADLGEAVRSIPQNFAGGQNPGVGDNAGGTNSNVNSGSGINLRGLGPDATLTLLNGHRLPYDSAFDAVDVSAIPLAAIDRIEIVADGASAVYGSDAVAGVANVILRRDFEGITTSTRLGGATEGGDFAQQFDVVTGSRWSTGGFMLAYDFQHNSAISASQRDYTADLAGANTLYPRQTHDAVTLSGHQDLAPGVTLTLDALWSKRTSTTRYGVTGAFDTYTPKLATWSIAPELDIELGRNWTLKLSAAYGKDDTHTQSNDAYETLAAETYTGCYCSSAISVEGAIDGPVFRLPGGDARIAIGVGYRDNRLDYRAFNDGTLTSSFNTGRPDDYAYGEAFLPIIAPEQHIPGVDRLSLSAAVRYEDYPHIAHIATPRFGLAYAPIHDLTLKASWARSFKAPTLYQQYAGYDAVLFPSSWYGVGSASQTILLVSGSNPNLKPERARNWTAGFDFTPSSVPRLTLSASYFNIDYRDRIATPLSNSVTLGLDDPAYNSLINYAPTASELTALVAGAGGGYFNYTGATLDPATVYALLDARYVNAAHEMIHGIDGQASYKLEVGTGKNLTFALAGTWLVSTEALTASLPLTQLAGTVFNPPHVRARGSVVYATDRLHAAGFVNYTGGLIDNRFSPAPRIAPQATLDLSISYTVIPGPKDNPGLQISLTINNLFDQHPPAVAQTYPDDTPYDSTNYSAIGRFIAVSIARHW